MTGVTTHPEIGVIGRLKANIAALGALDGVLYTADRALSLLPGHWRIYRYGIVAQPVADKLLLPPRRGRTIAVRRLERGDPALAGLPIDRKVLDFRFAQDVACLGAFVEDRVVGCLWLCFGTYQEDEVRCFFRPLPAGRAAWDFDVWVDPAHRTGMVFARLWDEANALMRERGIHWSISRISLFNPASLTAHARLGAMLLGSLTALQIGPFQLCLSSFSPRLSMVWGSSGLPTYRIPVPPDRSA